jgi:parallel beta-helix repeat protein
MTIGLGVMAGSAQGDPTVINTCPVVITSPGDYVLRADLICGGGDGITIASSGVTLKLEGHTITAGVGANQAIFVNGFSAGARSSARVLGPGLITNGGENTFSAGVRLFNTNNAEVSGITVRGSGSGISTTTTNFSTFTANTLGRNSVGIFIGDSTLNTISGNDASGNGTGILLDAETTVTVGTVSHNVLNGNTGAGLAIASESSGAAVQNNVINGNGQYGIFVQGPLESPLAVTNNTSLANGINDLFDGVPGCTGHVWSGNTFFTANQSCIH